MDALSEGKLAFDKGSEERKEEVKWIFNFKEMGC